MKKLYIILCAALLLSFVPLKEFDKITGYFSQQVEDSPAPAPPVETSVTNIVAKAEAFKLLLTSSQVSTLQHTYTTALAENWSNLPCGSQCRNGLEFNNMTDAQLTAAKLVIQAAAGTAANEGYDEFLQIVTADSILGVTASNGAYSKQFYFISFLNEPSLTGKWMLQFGGHHYAANIAFNGGIIVGVTPRFEGVEPKSFTAANGSTYSPLSMEASAMAAMLASLSTAQLSTAKLSGSFTDVVLGPKNDGNFPSTKLGIKCSTLSTAQKALVIAAMKPWVQDADDATADSLMSIYSNELDNTYISYAGNITFTSQGDYARIDGPSVWIEFVCQNGVVFPSQIHYHSIWRDHVRDYGNDLSNTALPLTLTSFNVLNAYKDRIISWTTSNEINVASYTVERSSTGLSNFNPLGTVAAKNSSTGGNYSFVDPQALSPTGYYYRLKITDADNVMRYSKTIFVKALTAAQLTVYPNPSSSLLNISVGQSFDKANIFIISSDGKTVQTVTGVSGNNTSIGISNLTPGLYIVKIINKGTTTNTKFIKQ